MNTINIPAKDKAVIPAITIGFDDNAVKAVIIICHGFGEHAGCYVELGDKLYEAGYASIILNQRGHGQPPENEKRWHGRIPGYQSFIDDIESLTEYARKELPGKPIVLYGHSMGGNIVINALLRMPRKQASQYVCAVLESPWLELFEPLSIFTVTLLRILNKITPNFRVVHRMRKSDLSTVAERADGYDKDPLYHGFLSARLLVGILNACDYVKIHGSRFPVEALLAYADGDVVVCNKAIADFAGKAGDRVTLKEYESKHAIHNDSNRELYFDDVIAYLDSKCKRT